MRPALFLRESYWGVSPLDNSVVFGVRAFGTGERAACRSTFGSGHLWELRAGRVVRWIVYPSADEALEAAGLRE